MALWGTIVNALAIIAGAVLGSIFQRIPDKMKQTIIQGLGLSVLVIGMTLAFKAGDDLPWVILSLVIGAIIGELVDIEGKLDAVGRFAERKMTRFGHGKISEAFVFASLLYCVGAMAIVGALESGLKADHSVLYTKSILDGFSAVIFTSTMGIGVAISAIPVLLYQGIIALSAEWLREFLSQPVIAVMSATGGVLIMGIALNVLEIRKINVGNLLPAIFVAGILKWFLQ
ncbi:DUF554 domain-containing protein [Effusibacillus lacus]|uniref:Membrane protein n=1 Tax=Effusibacillus lacus TaxID=1348429 RepID=A0A292YKZ6_9BACL|nr:DUF554 domain-containing protein [Effusibacillus lacus]TCS75185.1 hypothetical protein EDD64_109114 [Effusibacillus lacus]GAX89130.1 membrane protein [Effusibacillus lacus]